MSRSNPNAHLTNPSTRWIEWSGERGELSYWDKEANDGKGERVKVADGFAFILLDQLATIKGYHEASQSGIYSNEVRDTKQEVMIVRTHKGKPIAEGLYAAIKERVIAAGGKFTANCYIGFKNDDGELVLGSIQFKGASLSPWIEFTKAKRHEIFKKGIRIKGFTEGKKGSVTYKMPKFEIIEISEATDKIASALDQELQTYLTAYLGQPKTAQVHREADDDDGDGIPMEHEAEEPEMELEETDAPF